MERVFVLADSISMHYGPSLKKALSGMLAYDRKREPGQTLEDLNNPIGANGGDSFRILQYLQTDFPDTDILLVNCGLHDIRTDKQTGAKQVPLEQYAENLRQILALVKEKGVRMVWVNTTPVDDQAHNIPTRAFQRFNEDVIKYNEVAESLMCEANIPIIDLYTFTINLGPGVHRDGVHFHPEVSTLQAYFIAGALTMQRLLI